MRGQIESGQLCTVEPVVPGALKVGDIGLCKVDGRQYLHLVKAVQGKRFQIGNNLGPITGWVGENSIYGKCTSVE
jgi:hypothetical protein